MKKKVFITLITELFASGFAAKAQQKTIESDSPAFIFSCPVKI